MITVRAATDADTADVLELARLFLATSSYSVYRAPTPEDEERVLNATFALVQNHGVVYLAEEVLEQDELQPLGFIAIAAVPNLLGGQLIAEELAWFVRPDCRGGRAALLLLAAAEAWCRQMHLSGLKMVAPVDQPQVARFYTRRGYKAVETSYILRC